MRTSHVYKVSTAVASAVAREVTGFLVLLRGNPSLGIQVPGVFFLTEQQF